MIDTTDGVVRRQRVYLDDLDGFGILYHGVYPRLFDRALVDYWLTAGWSFDPRTSIQVVRELSLTYHLPVTSLGDIDVHFWVSRAGRTSVTYRFQFLSCDHETCYADGTRTMVNIDPTTLRPTAVPDELWDLARPLFGSDVTRSLAPASAS
jgi:acyl-CoA thioester hydrolase